jgi:uncharacterized membrane protein YdjX (TVP38/TMEM64 family)
MTEQIFDWLRSFGSLSLSSGLALMLLFVAASFVLLPRTFLLLGVGGLYGLQVAPIILASTVLGNVLAFLVARYLFFSKLRKWLSGRPRLHVIAQAVDEEAWKLVALLRLASPIPNSVQNYVFGLSGIRISVYTWTTLVCTIPQLVFYLYMGAAGRAFVENSSEALHSSYLAVAMGCMGMVVYVVHRKSRTALAKLSSSSQPSTESNHAA